MYILPDKLIRILKKEEGYVLPYILLITILLTTTILSVFTVLYYNNKMILKGFNKKKLDTYCRSEIYYLLKDSVIHKDTSYSYTKNNYHFSLNYRCKGFYLEVTISAKNNLDSSKVSYLIGNELPEYFNNALIISRPNLSLAYSGSTKIKGNILSSASQISQGRIFGIPVPDKNYLEGEISNNDNLPGKLGYDFIFDSTSYYNYLNHNSNPSKDILLDTISNSDYIIESNQDILISGLQSIPKKLKRIICKSNKTITLNGILTNYDLEIYSDSSVIITDNSRINNLIVFAQKEIIVNNSILQNAQLLSYKNIKLNNSYLKYPSTIGIFVKTDDKENLKNQIQLNNSTLNGSLILVSDVVGLHANKSKINIDDKSLVNGIIYCENNSEIKGSIIGSVYTYNTYFYQPPTEYINWLINLNINRNSFSGNNFLLPVFTDNNKFKILKEVWYY